MTAPASLIDDLEHALAGGNQAQRVEMLSRITDLFLASADRCAADQISLFDDVITKLATTIEAKARAKLAVRLAPVSNAPTGVIRMLAFDDDIEVARPVLRESERLNEADLLRNAATKSQGHLAAISERKSLSEDVTEVLVARGDQHVVRSVARNSGARFSDAGFRMLVKRSAGDEALAMQVGARQDLPRQHFLRLLDQASAAVRARLTAENPNAGEALTGVLSEVVGDIQSETRKYSGDFTAARAAVEAISRTRRLTEDDVYRFARERRFGETAVAMSDVCQVSVDVVERLLLDPRHEVALILAKIANFSSTTAKAILLLKSADRGMSPQDLDRALTSYARLQVGTARRVLNFYHARVKSGGAVAAPTG
jgi:uncharacterized protein (DUF2336 family)